MTAFIQNLLIEFINMGLMILIVCFTNLHSVFMSDQAKRDGQASKKYPGFVSDWYMDVGSVLNITFFVNIFWRNAMDFYRFCTKQLSRWRDRGFKSSKQKYPDDPDDDEPNTKKLVQEDLEKLYEGEDFEGDKNLSRMMSTLIVLLLYSPGMPFVYVLGFAFFVITYQINKLMLFKYYKRTDSNLNSDLPMACLGLLKYTVLLKLLAGLVMFTTPQIWYTRSEPQEGSFIYLLTIDVRKELQRLGGIELEEYDPNEHQIDFLAYLQYLH